MPLVEFTALPADARVWVFGAAQPMTSAHATQLLAVVDAYLLGWKAHGMPLTVGRSLVHERFLTIAVDQRSAGASGCSIDGLFRELQRVEQATGVSMIGGGRVFWRDADGTVHGGTRDDFAAAAAAGTVTRATPVFDLTLTTLGAWHASFECAASESWHAALLPVAT